MNEIKIGKIEKNIPMPVKNRNVYPFKDMKVGDSFLVEAKTREEKSKVSSVIGTCATYWTKKLNAKFARREVTDGYRIWRIE